ncbi:hypothetical protein [Streptomyces sp. NPDC012510]|uniref:hypothetical protein n=1 Tax=Streptomyces sp. NPDC012510 TaxID=3364838 RepID=UPI0036EA82C5
MSTNLQSPGQPLRRLPESTVPEGCAAWSEEQARVWTRSRPPVWVPVRTRSVHRLAVAVVGLMIGFWLVHFAEVRPALAAMVPLQAVWVLVRPEIVRVSSPLLTLVMAWYGDGHDPALVIGLLAVNTTWAMAEFRLSGGRTQKRWALAASQGVTAALPDGVGPLRRGRFLIALGLVLAAVGGLFVHFASGWPAAGDRREGMLIGWFVVGCGFTALLSGWFGRRRAAELRRGPVPVLRVLMRDGTDGDVEIFAADDLDALRPVFTVSAEEWYEDEDGDDEDEDGDDQDDREPGDEETDVLFDAIENGAGDDEQPGVLREAVLYGTPYDGGEVVIVSAPEDEDEEPDLLDLPDQQAQQGAGSAEIVVEASIGPVRPLSDRAVRNRIAAQKARARRNAALADRREAAALLTAERLGSGAVRRWRAGWLDRTVCLLAVLCAAVLVLSEGGGWRYVPGAVVGLIGAALLPGMAAWRITADRDGLWFNGALGTRHVEWDHLMTVKCEGGELTVDSRRSRFGGAWTAHAPRWARLERRFGLIHPYEKVAAEITAMWRDPALRPTGTSPERGRGMALWPLSVVLGVVWVAALLFVP